MHQHGGSPEKDFKRLGVPTRPVLDFSVNVSPLELPEAIQSIWPELITEMMHYPSVQGDSAKAFYASRFNLPHHSILPGNGSIELIYDIPRMLQLKRVLVPQPAFHDYSRACSTIGAEIISTQLNQLEGCDALFVGNPNNPTGKLIPAEVLLQLANSFPEIWFLIDEAFIQFVEEAQTYSLLHPDSLRRNIVIFHSLTKFYGLPGLRLGACISHPDTIARFEAQRPPWMVSRLAERISEQLTQCRDYDQQLRELVSSERERLFKKLETLPLFTPLPGAANFLLVQWTGSNNLDDLLRHLLNHGLYVRDCRNFPTLEENWFRIAIRTKADNNRLLKILETL